MAAPYLKDGKWYLRWKDEGGRWRGKGSTARTRTEAKRLQAELERRVERVRLGVEVALPEDGGGSLASLLQWWLDTYSKQSAAHATNVSTIRKHFFGSDLAALPLTAVTSGRIEAFLQAKSTQVSPQTLNHLRGYLSRAFNTAHRTDRYPGPNPAQDVRKRKVPKRQPDYLHRHEVPLLLRALDPRWRPIFAAALYTGLRKGELLALRKSDVDLLRQTLMVARSHERDTTKGGRAESIPVATELVPFLRIAIAAIQRVYEEVTGDTPRLISIGGGTYCRYVENTVSFGPVFPGQKELAHQKDENLGLEDLKKLAKIYAHTIYELIK